MRRAVDDRFRAIEIEIVQTIECPVDGRRVHRERKQQEKVQPHFDLSEETAEIFAGACLDFYQLFGERLVVQAFGRPTINKRG